MRGMYWKLLTLLTHMSALQTDLCIRPQWAYALRTLQAATIRLWQDIYIWAHLTLFR